MKTRYFLIVIYFAYCTSIAINAYPPNDPPIAQFTTADTLICEGETAVFFSQSENADSIRWLIDGATLSIFNETPAYFAFPDSGSYAVSLIAYNAFGTDTLTVENLVNVFPTPDIAIEIACDTSCLDEKHIIFSAFTNADAPQYEWSVAGFPNTAIIDTVLSTSDIPDTISLVITNAYGCSNPIEMPVEIPVPPELVINLHASVSGSGCAGGGVDKFHFWVESSNPIVLYESQPPIFDSNPTPHIYLGHTLMGYDLWVMVTDIYGCQAADYDIYWGNTYATPEIISIYHPHQLCVGQEPYFDADVSGIWFDYSENITGDPTIPGLVNYEFCYGYNGCWDCETVEIEYFDDFTVVASDSIICVGESINITENTDMYYFVYLHLYIGEDEVNWYDQNYYFDEPGVYPVWYEIGAWSSTGSCISDTLYISVLPPPEIELEMKENICLDLEQANIVALSNLIGDPKTYVWEVNRNFLGSMNDTVNVPSNFLKLGTNYVNVTVTNSEGCISSHSQTFTADFCSSLNPDDNLLEKSLFSMPNGLQCHIDFGGKTESEFSIKIFDIYGRLLATEAHRNLPDYDKRFNIPKANACLIVQMEIDGASHTSKIIH